MIKGIMVIEDVDKIVGLFNDLMKESVALLETLKKEGVGNVIEKEPELLNRIFDIGEGMGDLPKIMKDGIDLINESIEALAERYDEIKHVLIDAEELGINIGFSDVPIGLYLQIKEGKMSIGLGELDEYTFKIKDADMPMITKLLTGELDAMEAFMSGEISVEGSAGEAVKILPLVEFIKKLKG
jgi:putative sterol carrier protein